MKINKGTMNILRHLIIGYILGLLPTIEPRYACLYLLFTAKLNWVIAFIVSELSCLSLTLILIYFIEMIDKMFLKFNVSENNFLKRLSNLYFSIVTKSRKRTQVYINKYGIYGLILFVAIPLPFTGMWTAALTSLLFEIEKKKLFFSLFIGGSLSILIILLPSIGLTKIFFS